MGAANVPPPPTVRRGPLPTARHTWTLWSPRQALPGLTPGAEQAATAWGPGLSEARSCPLPRTRARSASQALSLQSWSPPAHAPALENPPLGPRPARASEVVSSLAPPVESGKGPPTPSVPWAGTGDNAQVSGARGGGDSDSNPSKDTTSGGPRTPSCTEASWPSLRLPPARVSFTVFSQIAC